MCYFIKCAILIFPISVLFIQQPVVANGDCRNEELFQDVTKWIFENESSQPVHLTQNFNKTEGKLVVAGTEVIKEMFKIIVFAIPYLKDLSECPINLTGIEDLREHQCIIQFEPSQDPSFAATYRNIFTGCYYVVIKNERDQNWMVGPAFYNTSLRYLDIKLKLERDIQIDPENERSSTKFKTVVKVPSSCIIVSAKLYEFPGHLNATFDVAKQNMINKTLPVTQDCMISNVGIDEGEIKCEVSNLTTNSGVEVRVKNARDASWTATITWTNLLRGGHTYYLQFQPRTFRCISPLSAAELVAFRKWKLVDESIICNMGYVTASNLVTKEKDEKSFSWVPVAIAIMGFIVMAVVAFWIFKFLRLLRKGPRADMQFRQSQEIVPMDVKESDHVLLIYVKGCSLFMRTIGLLRDRLKQDVHCHVHDLYSTEDWNDIAELGASGWVERLLKNGTKVVWIDTPEFRSRLNDKNSQIPADDFRDMAVPYAVNLAKDLFQNATTQYRHHFVVRLEGFEVDDSKEDPLQVVSPHTRYYIPTHISLLIKDLRGPAKILESETVEV